MYQGIVKYTGDTGKDVLTDAKDILDRECDIFAEDMDSRLVENINIQALGPKVFMFRKLLLSDMKFKALLINRWFE